MAFTLTIVPACTQGNAGNPRPSTTEGVVATAKLISLTQTRLCMRPDGVPHTRVCYRVTNRSDIQNGIHRGDHVTVNEIGGEVIAAGPFNST